MDVLDLTIAIPAKNAAKLLPDCLNAIGKDFAKEIVIIDSDSRDETRKVANQYGVRVHQFHWKGTFPKKRNWFLIHHSPKTKWVLFLDADEWLTEEFKAELRQELSCSNKVGYWLNYRIYFEGKVLRGGYPLQKLALFQVGAGFYEYINEENWSPYDMEIHEHPQLNGDVGEICAMIDHRDFYTVESWKRKHDHYAEWEAQRLLQLERDGSSREGFTFKQRIKYLLMKTPFAGWVYFLGSYLLLGGFRDGLRGYRWAKLKQGYFDQVSRLYREGRYDD